MPGQRLVQRVRCVFTSGTALGAFDVVEQGRAVTGMGAFFYDEACALYRRQAAQLGQALLGHDHRHVMLGVVHVRGHGHDAGKLQRQQFGRQAAAFHFMLQEFDDMAGDALRGLGRRCGGSCVP